MSLDEFFNEKLGIKKPEKRKYTPKTKKLIVPQEIKRLLERINRNLDKTWGYDNKMGKEKGKPKYRNLWEDWNALKEWFNEISENNKSKKAD
ncbi:hypothetical protein LCGC14_0838350 [marine sediment metagenome]|uniref:Uncharacterized protein n=1 Tax=marine sediment metagenome TaxID=412755 RepID=A0A0F9SL68_9ZZZZ